MKGITKISSDMAKNIGKGAFHTLETDTWGVEEEGKRPNTKQNMKLQISQ